MVINNTIVYLLVLKISKESAVIVNGMHICLHITYEGGFLAVSGANLHHFITQMNLYYSDK